MKINKVSKIISWPHLPIILLLIIDLCVGILTIKQRGLSWDEPLFYNYADNIGYAYSISARLAGTFNLENAYGIDPEEHKQYGPAYLLIAKPITNALERIPGVDEASAWHLVNFFTFQVGILFFYLLSRRWVENSAAFFSACLFATQPLLWGHGFINPKDIPFAVFFIVAIYFGFRMADTLSVVPDNSKESDLIPTKRFLALRNGIFILAVISGILAILLFSFSRFIAPWIEAVIRQVYAAPSGTLLGQIFTRFAPNAFSRPVTGYIVKALIVYNHTRIGIFVLAIILFAVAAFIKFRQKTVLEALQEIRQTKVSPLSLMVAGVFVGLSTSIRVLGPLAGVLICVYMLVKYGRRVLGIILLYGLIGVLVSYATWPYVWASPIASFIDVLNHMSNNPQPVSLLFNGISTNSVSLPISYMPTLLAFTLTEPVWVLFFLGIIYAIIRYKQAALDWKAFLIPVAWFLIPLVYVLVRRPPMYDGIRHFLFMLPGVFLVAGSGIQAILKWIKYKWVNGILILAILLPGIIGIVRLYPYEYTYYNTFTGGTQGAFRKYDTDFWLTCYKDAMQYIDENAPKNTVVFVLRNPALALNYAIPGIVVQPYQREPDNTFPGSLLLLTTRANVDLEYHADAPVFYQDGRDGAVFCVVKQIK